ncbi:DUF4328 domain-containing protein [Brevibacillus migulae]|uniref:DUF4328 domain-containing protein n=1 Tax=Brevibacillus migulae TaxID=1644114 RepID=UPI00106F02DE|nr:DUF4328 domain-containing protein [Brevibacillus migulae]
MTAKSIGIGKFLFIFLCVGIVLSFLLALCSLAYAIDPEWFLDYVETVEIGISILSIFLLIVTFALFFIWIFRVHRDFKQISDSYPVTPWGALARILIPIYNLVGLWTIYRDMAHFLIARESKELRSQGWKLKSMIPYYYFPIFVQNILNRIIFRSDERLAILEIVAFGVDIFLNMMYIRMVVLISKGIVAANEEKALQLSQQVEAAELQEPQ